MISDEPGFVYRADLRTPRLLNDPSVKRIDQHLLTTDMVADAARDPDVCAVVVWSDRFGRDLPGLPDRAARRRARRSRAPGPATAPSGSARRELHDLIELASLVGVGRT